MEGTWHADRIALPLGDPEREAAQQTETHADAPTEIQDLGYNRGAR